jgi:hypothetical protein
VADRSGNPPRHQEQACGWRQVQEGWRPQGVRVGWLDGSDLYLDADAAYWAAQRMASDGNRIDVTVGTLKRRLRESRMLASTDQKHETLTIRRIIQRREHDVLHMHAEFLSLHPDQPDKSDIDLSGAFDAQKTVCEKVHA